MSGQLAGLLVVVALAFASAVAAGVVGARARPRAWRDYSNVRGDEQGHRPQRSRCQAPTRAR